MAVGVRIDEYRNTQLCALAPVGGLFGSTCTQAKLEAAGRRFQTVAKANASAPHERGYCAY